MQDKLCCVCWVSSYISRCKVSVFLVHRIRITDIISGVNNSYLTLVILPKLRCLLVVLHLRGIVMLK